MQTTAILKRCSVAVLALTSLVACRKDGEKMYLSGLEKSELTVSETDVVLSRETSSEVVLSLAWSSSTLAVSDPGVSAPDVFTAHIQMSTADDFSSNVYETLGENESRAYTGAELNTIVKGLGLAPDVSTPVHFRIRGSAGANMGSVYSEAKTVGITSYFVDMSSVQVLDADRQPTGIALYSAASDGIYAGFVGATSWMNFWMEEGDGTLWGNSNTDDGGLYFEATSTDPWNFWYPSPGGCYYTTLNTVTGNLSALYLPVLSVSGDVTGDMSYDRANNRWFHVFEAASAGDITIRLSGQGDRYDSSTGDAAPATDKVPIAFTQNGANLALANAAGDITVHVTAAGESTLTIDLSDPKAWTASVAGGSSEPEPVIEEVFLVGIEDGFPGGNWNFDRALKLYDEEGRKYSGVANVNSLYGYQIAIEKENWSDVYALAEGDASAGTLVYQDTSNNIPAPTPGLYYFDVDLANLSYALTPIGGEIYVSGLDDVWDFTTTLSATETPGVFSGEITVTKVTEWGFKIYLIADNWNIVYGGYDGTLYFNGNDGINPAEGTYTMTVDLVGGTYTIE